MDLINITTSTYQSKVHPNSKDVSITNVSLILKGREIVIDGNITLNWGQRYGLLGANGELRGSHPCAAALLDPSHPLPSGCGKSLLLSVIGRRLLPLPANLDVYLLMSEIEASDMTALEVRLAARPPRLSAPHSPPVAPPSSPPP